MAKRPLRVCLVSPIPPPYGGVGHWGTMILRKSADCPCLSVFTVNTAPRWREIDDLRIWKRLLGGSLQFLRDITVFVAKLFFLRPNVVHITTSGEFAVLRDRALMAVARLAGVPVVYHLHFGRVPQIATAHTREWRWIARAMRCARSVIAIDSRTTGTIARLLPNVHSYEVPNCIAASELPAHAILDNGRAVVLYLGHVVPSKGIEELFAAWSHLKPQGWTLRIVGAGDPEYPRSLFRKYCPDNVEILAELPHNEAMEALAAADICVLPSYTEGFPFVILEAMALGKAIVATRVGAIPEMLADGCGVLVEPKDPPGLADALKQVMASETLRLEMGRRARERALQEYSIDAVFEQLNRIWAEAARAKTPSTGRQLEVSG